jgi:uncharacterized membrane protein (UPF0127 family)
VIRWLLPALLAGAAVAEDCAPDAIRLETGDGVARFSVEIADTPDTRAQGLMFRTDLARDAGMLFLFEDARPVTFWMKNTPLSLDMIFIGADGVVCGLIERATPHSLVPRPSGCDALAELEVHGGVAEEIDLAIGARVSHPAFGADAAWPCAVARPPQAG